RRVAARARRRAVLCLRVPRHRSAVAPGGGSAARRLERGHGARGRGRAGGRVRAGGRGRRTGGARPRPVRARPARPSARLASARAVGGAVVHGVRCLPCARRADRRAAGARHPVVPWQPARRAPRVQPRGLARHGHRGHVAHLLPVAHPYPAASSPATPTFWLWLAGVVLLAAGAAFGSTAAVAAGLAGLLAAAACLALNLIASLRGGQTALTLPARLIAVAQCFLAAGLVTALAA